MSMPSACFDSYTCDRLVEVVVNLDTMQKILTGWDDEDPLTIQHRVDNDVVSFVYGSPVVYTVAMTLVDLGDLGDVFASRMDCVIPDTEYGVVIRMPSAALNMICEFLQTAGDAVQIVASMEDCETRWRTGPIMITVKSSVPKDGLPTVPTVAQAASITTVSVSRDIEMIFALKYMHLFSEQFALHDTVTLKFVEDNPVLVQFDVDEEKDGGGFVRYYLASKLKPDVE